MGKKEQKKNASCPNNQLPQNIVFIGEKVDGEKNIYISQETYKSIHKFTKDKVINESGGVLIGDTITALGKTNIVINGFIEAKHAEGTPTTLKFTHETWQYIHEEMDKKYSEKKMLGWIHTHPSFGIFLSEYDTFIHQNYFNEDYEIAYVVDPIQNTEGFFYWINGNIERCPGFYIYDKPEKKISIGIEDEGKEKKEEYSIPMLISWIITALAVLALIVSIIITNNKIKNLNEKLYEVGTAFESIMIKQYNDENTIADLSRKINILEEELTDINETLKDNDNIANDSITVLNDGVKDIRSKLDELTIKFEGITTTDSEADYKDDLEVTDTTGL